MDPNDEIEKELKDVIRKYVEDEEKVQELHDELANLLRLWGIDIYP